MVFCFLFSLSDGMGLQGKLNLTTASKHQKYSCFHQLETIVGFDQIIPS
jgi:hypothetical protein